MLKQFLPKLKQLPISLGLVAIAAQASTAEQVVNDERWYQVDLVLVAYTDESTIGNELWPATIMPTEAEENIDKATEQAEAIDTSIDTTALDNTTLNNNALEEQETVIETPFEKYSKQQHPWVHWWNKDYSGGYKMTAHEQIWRTYALNPNTDFAYEVNRLNKQSGMQVIWQGSWHQDIQDRSSVEKLTINAQLEQEIKNIKPIIVSSSEEQTDFAKQLLIDISGDIKLSRSRYLHIDTDLELKQAELSKVVINPQDSSESNISSDSDISVDAQPLIASAAGGFSNTFELNPERAGKIVLTEDVITPLRTATVKLKRRMRSGEIHYLDHPLLGILIKVTPIEDAKDNNKVGSSSSKS